jgi:hypothetical protein
MLLSLGAIWLLGSFPVRTAADYIPPGKVTPAVKAYTPTAIHFPVGTYRYDLNWQGIPVGRSSITIAPSVLPDGTKTYKVRASAQSASVVALFYTLRHVSESVFHAETLAPIIFLSMQKENAKTKSREVRFDENGQVTGNLYYWKKGKFKQEERQAFQGSHTTFDPITATFLARSIVFNKGDEVSFDVFNGKHRYLISLKRGESRVIPLFKKGVEAFSVTPTIKKLTDSDGEKRLRQCTIWVTADSKRDVAKLECEAFIGTVRAELTGFTPASDTPVPIDTNAIRTAFRSPDTELARPTE